MQFPQMFKLAFYVKCLSGSFTYTSLEWPKHTIIQARKWFRNYVALIGGKMTFNMTSLVQNQLFFHNQEIYKKSHHLFLKEAKNKLKLKEHFVMFSSFR